MSRGWSVVKSSGGSKGRHPLILRPNLGPKGHKIFLFETGLPPLSQGLDDCFPPLPKGLDLPLKSYFYQQNGGTLFVFSFVKCLEEEMCLGCLVKGRCLSQTYRHLKLKLRLILFFKCHI